MSSRLASATNSLAVVSASPSAWWGVSAGWPSAPASRPSEIPCASGVAVPVAQPAAAEHLGVGRGRQAHASAGELPVEERRLDRRGVEHRHATGERRQQEIDRLVERWRVGDVGQPQLVHEHCAHLRTLGRAHERVDAAAEPIRPASIGTAPIAMISSVRGFSPVISRSTAHQPTSRHGVVSAGRGALANSAAAPSADRRSLTRSASAARR